MNTTGYLNNSPHRFNSKNIIPGGEITMSGVDTITLRELFEINGLSLKRSDKLKCIYKITNPKGAIYIGKSTNFYERLKNYVSSYNKRKKDQVRLNNSLYKYGFKTHKIEIIEIVDNPEILAEKEINYILLYDTFNTPHGMNLTSGGEGVTGRKMTEANKIKLIEANKNKVLTDKQRETISRAHKRRVSNRKGVTLSEETKKRISKSKIGSKASEETKRKMSIIQTERRRKNQLNLIAT